MYSYTLKIDEKKQLQLIDEQNQNVSFDTLLSLMGNRRVLAFLAPMGTGKTTLITKLCATLGTTDVVNSPTFAIVNVYELPNHAECYHMDCYRLQTIREAQDMGMEEYLYSGNWCFIEWPELIQPLLPDDTVYITLTKTDTEDRLMTFDL